MKLLIASDIHGDAESAQFIADKFSEIGADYLVLLGDILYHGPRNDLPGGHNPKQVVEILNGLKDKIIAVRGNCDAEVDEMVLEFPLLATYNTMIVDAIPFFLTHGHIYSMQNIPESLKEGVFLQGHTHIPVCTKEGSRVLINPGSVSIPKGGFDKTYAVYENKTFTVLDFNGKTVFDLTI